MKNVHLMHVLNPLTDLFCEQDGIHLCQTVVIVNNSVKQFSSIHTAERKMVEQSLSPNSCLEINAEDILETGPKYHFPETLSQMSKVRLTQNMKFVC